ncbi:MAG TPA: VWA domain-containing protein [Roseiflexaceae bacterium]|nr:VWA domain-containing protein [Roseiflexaceae bacterium]
MPRLTFITSAALALLALLPLMWAFALLTPRRLAPWRFWLGLVLRSVILCALVLGIAGTQLVQPVNTLTTVFLIDASDSVAPAQRERAIQYVDEALRSMPPADKAAVVVFGANALVERAPASLAALGTIGSVPVTTRTNLQDALQLGLALLPAESQKRIVLLSDGGENSGRAVDAARLAAVRGVPLDVVTLPSEHGADVLVSSVDAPSLAREGQEVALSASIRSSFATTGKLQVFVDGQLAAEQNVSLSAGQNNLPVRVPAGAAGFRRLEVRLEAQGDTEPQNNRAAAFTEVQGPPRMLLIAGEADRAANLQSALESAGVRVDLRSPNQAPASLDQLSAYAAVVLVDTPARDVPRPLLQALPAYVRELGRGLAMIGGTESFGAGGYRRAVEDPTGASIEDALPVNLDPLDASQMPDLALAMVIDRSGSMGEAGGSGRTKLDLAKEAVYQASLGLTQRDQISLIVFDDTADALLPLQKLPPAVEIEQALSGFNSGSGTNIRPGLVLAADSLANANAKIKHIILMTDGIAPSNYGDVIDQLRGAGVTISTVAIGDDADAGLADIATRGGGRYYQIKRIEDVPKIFLQETVVVAGRDIIEGKFAPSIALQAPVVRGLNGLPPLYGYNGTEIKEAARAILVTPDGKPILAQWQYGLGRAVAWTSDLKGQWGRDWVGWDQFPRFVGGFADMLLPPPAAGTLTLRTSSLGTQSALELTAQDDQGRLLNQLALKGILIDPENRSVPISFSQIGAGQYRANVSTTTPGVYLAQVAALSADGQPIGSATTGLVVSYSPEYGETRDNPQLLRELAAISAGRVDPTAAAIFDPPAQAVGSVREIGLPLLWLALLLLPLDIGLRRLHLRLGEYLPRLARLRGREQPGDIPADESMARLSAAKRRARVPTRDIRAVPELRASVTIAPPQPEPRRAAEAQAPAAPAAAPATPQPAQSDDQLARLLAAKQRARKKSSDS